MRRLVVASTAGDIIATGPHPEDEPRQGEGAPDGFGYIPLEGQVVYEVEFPDGASLEDLLRFHDTHRIQTDQGTARLVAR